MTRGLHSFVAILLCSIGLLPGETQPARPKPAASTASFDAVAAQAREARQANRLEEAVDLYRKALRLRPGWNEGLWYLGTTLYELDRHAEARDALRRFVAQDRKSGPAFAILGLCEFNTREYERSLASLDKAVSLDLSKQPELQPIVYYHYALLLTRFEQPDLAIAILQQFAQEGKESTQLIEAVGIAALRLPMLPSEVAPQDREKVMLGGRAIWYSFRRNSLEAGRQFKALAEKYPGQPGVHFLYGSFLMFSEPDQGLVELNKELEISPRHVPARVAIVFEYLKRGEAAKGVSYAREAAGIEPKNFITRTTLGRALAESGDFQAGIAELEEAKKLAPEVPQTRIALASAYAKVGRKDEAARERAEFLRLKARTESGRSQMPQGELTESEKQQQQQP